MTAHLTIQLSLYLARVIVYVAGIAIASSLVTLGNPRKVSVDPTQKLEADTQGSKTRKSRKVVGVASMAAGSQPTDL